MPANKGLASHAWTNAKEWEGEKGVLIIYVKYQPKIIVTIALIRIVRMRLELFEHNI